jgi:hypothetical protein
MTSTTFKVDDVTVDPPSREVTHTSLPHLFSRRLSKEDKFRVEAFSTHPKELIRLGGRTSSGFFLACVRAYSEHLNLSLDPDSFKLIILQGLAQHINQNPEKFRKDFVSHKGQKHIQLLRDDFVMGSTKNEWGGLFEEFAQKIDEDLKDKTLYKMIQSPMTTSTPTTIASFNVALMDAMQSYFSYGFTTCCGIPNITLKGTPEDWSSLIKLAEHISQYDLDWWTTKHLIPILKKILQTVENPETRDVKFWSNLINEGGGSGGPYYSGWICKLFPYLQDERQGPQRNIFNYSKNFGGGITLSEIPSGISNAPVTWEYLGVEHNMVFTSGFYGYLYDPTSHTLSPEISWIVYEKM